MVIKIVGNIINDLLFLTIKVLITLSNCSWLDFLFLIGADVINEFLNTFHGPRPIFIFKLLLPINILNYQLSYVVGSNTTSQIGCKLSFQLLKLRTPTIVS
jgi:hypothetical protein